jgi:thioredoxin reductase (NADPH)
LGIAGENEFAGRGVSYCATCDGPFFKGEDIAVVGGGDTALEEATFLTKFGRSVKIIHRRDTLRGSKILQEKALENSKIQFLWDNVIIKIKGNKKIEQIEIKNLKSGKIQTLRVGGLFVAIGHEPNTSIFKNQLELSDKGYIVLTEHTKTSVPGVFAAGDVHDFRYRQAVSAAGFGCMGALDVEKWLSESGATRKKETKSLGAMGVS